MLLISFCWISSGMCKLRPWGPDVARLFFNLARLPRPGLVSYKNRCSQQPSIADILFFCSRNIQGTFVRFIFRNVNLDAT